MISKISLIKKEENNFESLGYNDCLHYYKKYLSLGIDKFLEYLQESFCEDALIEKLFTKDTL